MALKRRWTLGLEIIVLLAGSAVGIAALGVVIYRAIPNRSVPAKVESENNQTPPQVSEPKITPEPEPVSEAPPPFPEDSRPPVSKGVATPSDTTALGVSSPYLTISLSKTVQKGVAKNKRRRRTVKARSFPQSLGTPAIPSIDSNNNKDPSAA